MESNLENSKNLLNDFFTLRKKALQSNDQLRTPGNIISIKNYQNWKNHKVNNHKTYETNPFEYKQVKELININDTFHKNSKKDLIIFNQEKHQNVLFKSMDISKNNNINIRKHELKIPRELKFPISRFENLIKYKEIQVLKNQSRKINNEMYQKSVNNHKIFHPKCNQIIENENKLSNHRTFHPKMILNLGNETFNNYKEYFKRNSNSESLQSKQNKIESSPLTNFNFLKPIYDQNNSLNNPGNFDYENTGNFIMNGINENSNLDSIKQKQCLRISKNNPIKYFTNQEDDDNYKLIISSQCKQHFASPSIQQNLNFEKDKILFPFKDQLSDDYNQPINNHNFNSNSLTEITKNNKFIIRENTPRNDKLKTIREEIKNKHSLLNKPIRNFTKLIITEKNNQDYSFNLNKPEDTSQFNRLP